MIKRVFLSVPILAFMLMACGDNIRPGSDTSGDDEGCVDEDCPATIDEPDAGAPLPDAGTGGGTDGGTGTGTDGGTGTCGTCPEGQVCIDGACVCDHEDDPSDGGCAPEEVHLCHVPNGNPDASHGICVGSPAVTAHLAHGDTLGACP